MEDEINKGKQEFRAIQLPATVPTTRVSKNKENVETLSNRNSDVESETKTSRIHLEHVYYSQLKPRLPKTEGIPARIVDIAQIARLIYPAIWKNVMERLVVQTFLDLRPSKPSKF